MEIPVLPQGPGRASAAHLAGSRGSPNPYADAGGESGRQFGRNIQEQIYFSETFIFSWLTNGDTTDKIQPEKTEKPEEMG